MLILQRCYSDSVMHIPHSNEVDNTQITDEYSIMLLSHYFIFRYMYKPSAILNTASRNDMCDLLQWS